LLPKTMSYNFIKKVINGQEGIYTGTNLLSHFSIYHISSGVRLSVILKESNQWYRYFRE
jgi:hypothetical protein